MTTYRIAPPLGLYPRNATLMVMDVQRVLPDTAAYAEARALAMAIIWRALTMPMNDNPLKAIICHPDLSLTIEYVPDYDPTRFADAARTFVALEALSHRAATLRRQTETLAKLTKQVELQRRVLLTRSLLPAVCPT